MDDPVRHERFVAVGKKDGWTKKANIRKSKTSSFYIDFSMNGTKRYPIHYL